MTKFKGTKGRWKKNGINGIHTQNGTCIAVTYSVDKNEKESNALLISKAPEMLEMLKEVSDILNVDEFLHDTSIRQYFYHQIQEINDLIKEATEL